MCWMPTTFRPYQPDQLLHQQGLSFGIPRQESFKGDRADLGHTARQ